MLANRVRMSTLKDSSSIPEGYVLATDDDFTIESYGIFIYIGNDLKIAIPDRIYGTAVTTYDYMFTTETGRFVEGVVSYNTNVTSMEGMFRENLATELDLSLLDTSNVTNMSFMFDSSRATTFDLSSFDTSNVTNMSFMFFASSATTLDLSSFDTSKVTDMSDMFTGASATIGYARTQADADRFNASSGKPEELTFVVKP